MAAAFPMTSASYPAVRALLDTSLTTTQLPDATIALPIYADAAALEVKARDTAWATRTGDDLQHLENAQVALTAARLLPALDRHVQETAGDVSVRRENLDLAERLTQLQQMAAAELAAILLGSETTPGRPTMFARATGTRGKLFA